MVILRETETYCVFCEVQSEFSYKMQINFTSKTVNATAYPPKPPNT